MKFVTYVTYSEVSGHRATEEMLSSTLRGYRRTSVLLVLSKINCVLQNHNNEPNLDIDAKLAQALGLPTPRFQALGPLEQPKRIHFSRAALLLVMKYAFLTCSEDGYPVESTEDCRKLATCCLMAHDLLDPGSSNGHRDLIANLLRAGEYVPANIDLHDIVRNQLIFNTPEIDCDSFAARFHERTGLSHRTFSQIAFCLSSKYLAMDVQDLNAAIDVEISPAYLASSNFRQEDCERFFALASTTEEEFSQQLAAEPNNPGSHLRLMQQHPLIRVPRRSVYICLDPGFLLGKAGNGLFWTLRSSSSSTEGNILLSKWGKTFERYVNWLLLTQYKGQGTFFANPCFSNGDEAFDAYLLEGSTLMVFETKGGVLSSDSKHSADPEPLHKALIAKFLLGEGKEASGAAQLQKGLYRFLGGEPMDKLQANQVSKVFPVLLSRDRALVAPGMNHYMNQFFNRRHLSKECHKTVTPLSTVHIADLEGLLSFTAEYGLSDLFQRHYRQTGKMPGQIHPAGLGIAGPESVPKQTWLAPYFEDLFEDLQLTRQN